ncbi:MAG TPA: hypothetical protein VLE02_02050 [Nitrosarchaeum sp.]|nr:hypothetical protein [Nitrosarchaeum sp.]
MNFSHIQSQCLDSKGKCLILNFKKVSVIVWPPYAPFVDVQSSDKFIVGKAVDAYKFASDHEMEISKKSGKYATNGFFLVRENDSRIYFIPLEKNSEKFPIGHIKFPTVSDKSTFDDMRMYRDIANYLKSYFLFEWAHLQNEDSFSETLDRTSFVVIKNHTYNLEKLRGRLIRYNDVMYKNKKLIVLSEEMGLRLCDYVKIQQRKRSYTVVSDTEKSASLNYAKKYRETKYIDGYVENINNYDNENAEIFTDKRHMFIWAFSVKKNVHLIAHHLESHLIIEPYLISISHILNGRVCMVQNTKAGDILTATTVCGIWSKNNINEGFFCEAKEEYDVPCNIYDHTSLVKKEESVLYVLKLSEDKYSAILPL